MPKRKNLVRQWTWAQGNDSWVEYVPFTVADRFNPERTTNTRDEIVNRVKKWNWTDVDGNPLPQPEDDNTVFDDLTLPEMSCLVDVVMGYPNRDDVKN